MNEKQPSDALRATRDYYEQHAEQFAQRTADVDMSALYVEFLSLLPPGGSILDAGCGTGRDSAAFIARGFKVLAFDASKAMVDIATKRIQQPVLHISFDQMQFDHEFDGVWARALLLHNPKNRMPWVFEDLHNAMVPKGILYASFKEGAGEEFREGRLFNDYTEEELRAFIPAQPRWSLIKLWTTDDVRQHRPNLRWFNLLARAV